MQCGSQVYFYDEREHQLAMLQGGNGPQNGLKGYTGVIISVRRGGLVHTSDKKGRQVSLMPAR